MEFKKYLKLSNYTHHLRIVLNRNILHCVECMLFAMRGKTCFKHKPIFILGAPRSGSTLLVQVLHDAFDLGCLNNGHAKFFGSPVVAEKIFRPPSRQKSSDYTSDYGRTKSIHESSECGEFWYRFFRKDPPYVSSDDVCEKKMHCFRGSLSALSRLQGKPLLLKNLYATLRIRPINRFIPESLFIIVKRDEIDNAHSILQGRMKANGNYCEWWSVPPDNVEDLIGIPAEQQVVEQIRRLNALIERDMEDSEIESNRYLVIKYEDFCDDVYSSLATVEKFLLKNGLNVNRRLAVPASFPRRKKINIDHGLYDRMVAYSKATRGGNKSEQDDI